MRERLLAENGWQHYLCHLAERNVHYMVCPMLLGWDKGINDFITITQVKVTINIFQCCATAKQF